jgi:hypothetical protein
VKGWKELARKRQAPQQKRRNFNRISGRACKPDSPDEFAISRPFCKLLKFKCSQHILNVNYVNFGNDEIILGTVWAQWWGAAEDLRLIRREGRRSVPLPAWYRTNLSFQQKSFLGFLLSKSTDIDRYGERSRMHPDWAINCSGKG